MADQLEANVGRMAQLVATHIKTDPDGPPGPALLTDAVTLYRNLTAWLIILGRLPPSTRPIDPALVEQTAAEVHTLYRILSKPPVGIFRYRFGGNSITREGSSSMPFSLLDSEGPGTFKADLVNAKDEAGEAITLEGATIAFTAEDPGLVQVDDQGDGSMLIGSAIAGPEQSSYTLPASTNVFADITPAGGGDPVRVQDTFTVTASKLATAEFEVERV